MPGRRRSYGAGWHAMTCRSSAWRAWLWIEDCKGGELADNFCSRRADAASWPRPRLVAWCWPLTPRMKGEQDGMPATVLYRWWTRRYLCYCHSRQLRPRLEKPGNTDITCNTVQARDKQISGRSKCLDVNCGGFRRDAAGCAVHGAFRGDELIAKAAHLTDDLALQVLVRQFYAIHSLEALKQHAWRCARAAGLGGCRFITANTAPMEALTDLRT